MENSLVTNAAIIAAITSACAAAASAVAAFWSAKVTKRLLQVQIKPSISVAFDNNVKERRSIVMRLMIRNLTYCQTLSSSLSRSSLT